MIPIHPFGLGDDLDCALDAARDDLGSLDGTRTLITGGTGFVGSWMLELFAWAADRLGTAPRIVVLTRDPARFAASWPHLAAHRTVSVLRGDVRRPSSAVGGGEVDFAVGGATASLASGDAADDRGARETTIAGGEMLREILQRCACRGLYLSSGAASRPEPDAYGRAKLDAEQLLLAGPVPARAVVARLYAFVGPYLPLNLNFAVGNFLADALAHRPVVVAGDGTSVRSYLYASDLAWWLWSLLLRGDCGKFYDVGSHEAVTIRRLAELAAALAEPRLPVVLEGRPMASSAGGSYLPDTAAAAELGLRTTCALDVGLRRTYDWHRAVGAVAPGRVVRGRP